MKTGFAFTLLMFGSGVIFGYGLNMAFTKEAVKTAYDYGKVSMLAENLNDTMKDVPDKTALTWELRGFADAH